VNSHDDHANAAGYRVIARAIDTVLERFRL